jgi:glycosyltransferase involved in cell wall biosynthesis
MTPRVSVVMPVYNGEKYLDESIKSILNQTFRDFEFIILNDGSFDSTPRLLADYAARDPRLIVHHFASNQGLPSILNFGIRQARGEYIARMDMDDVSLPERFENQVRFLDSHDDVAVVGTGVRFIDDQGNAIEEVHHPADHDLIKWYLCFYNPIAHPSVMIRKTFFEQVGGYNKILRRSQDYDLWWRLSMEYQLANLDGVYILLRQHHKQASTVYRNEQVLSAIKISSKYVSRLLDVCVSEEVIETFWSRDIPPVDKSIAVSAFLFDYLDLRKKSFGSKKNQKIITRDTVAKVLYFTLPHIGKINAWSFILKTARMDLIGFLNTTIILVGKFTLRFLRNLLKIN